MYCETCLRTPPPHEWVEQAKIHVQGLGLARVFRHKVCGNRTVLLPERSRMVLA